jgi:hypothetical protein
MRRPIPKKVPTFIPHATTYLSCSIHEPNHRLIYRQELVRALHISGKYIILHYQPEILAALRTSW